MLTGQLQAALDRRVVIEQAKGFVAHRLGVDVDAAFAVLRRYARSHNLKLTAVAEAVTRGDDGHDVFATALPGRTPLPPDG